VFFQLNQQALSAWFKAQNFPYKTTTKEAQIMNLKAKLLSTVAVLSSISASIFIAPISAHANAWSDEVGVQLARYAVLSGFNGYDLTHEPLIDTLDRGRSDYITINLRAGNKYGIIGVCDGDCRDLDIALYDRRGKLITSDMQDDDIPAIGFTPTRSGTYRVRVDMAHCRTGACYYGVGVFGK
jgi:hypothetical protein